MSFKLQQASQQGGRLAEAKLNHPQDTTGDRRGVVNTIVRVMGSLYQTDGVTGAVGANGLPLNVVGKVLLPVKLGDFQQNQEFVVARNLSVQCLLGADFLVQHQAIIDCKAGKLSLKGAILPITMGNSVAPQDSPGVPVQVTETLEVPARSVMLIQPTVQGGRERS